MIKIEKKVNWFQRFYFELYYLIVLNIIIILIDFNFFILFWELSEVVILGLLALLMFRRSSRIIYKIEFDDMGQKMNMYYYQFILFNYSTSIPYSQLNFKYHKKNYGIVNRMYALIFLSEKNFIAEIKNKNRGGWTKNEIREIIDKLNTIKNERSLQV